MVGFVLLLQAGQSVTAPTWGALVPRIVGDELVGKAMGLQQSLSASPVWRGAAAGGVLFDAHRLPRDNVDRHRDVRLARHRRALLVRTRRGRRYDAAKRRLGQADRASDASSAGWSVIECATPCCGLLVPASAGRSCRCRGHKRRRGIPDPRRLRRRRPRSTGWSSRPSCSGRSSARCSQAGSARRRRRVTWTAMRAAGVVGALIVAIGLSPSVWVVLAPVRRLSASRAVPSTR